MVPSIIADAHRFPVLADHQMSCVRQLGQTLELSDREEILSEGEAGYDFYVVLRGRIEISKRTQAGPAVLRLHREGEFIGELSILAGGASPVTARAQGDAVVVRLSRDAFRDVLARCPEMAETVIPAMARRLHDVEALLQEREKLAALGKLAAGLAHELNNPAAAGGRAVAGIRSQIGRLREHALRLGASCFSPVEVAEIQDQLVNAAAVLAEGREIDPLTRSDQEEAVGTWLEERGCDSAWERAGVLVSAGLTLDKLVAVSNRFGAESSGRLLDFLGSQLTVEQLLVDAERSLNRVSEIVRAVKGYSRMDLSPIAEIDVCNGIEDTLKILAYPLRPFEVIRDYGKTPSICAYAGELNQVWTNLIDNAVGAMGERGTLTIRTRAIDDEAILVEISDTGPGIPEAVQARIFEPFFTTKPAGEGTGLGLDIVNRIVTMRHNGKLEFRTGPEGTTFSVRLPVRQPTA